MPSSADVKAGRVPPKVIENDVIVTPGAQVNEHTLPEHQRAIARLGTRPLDIIEAARLGYPSDQIADWFGNAN
jgi:hypothetical protein